LKLGLSTWSLLQLDVESAVKAIGNAGLEYIELWGEIPHAYPGWADRGRLRDALSAYDMVVTTHAPFTDLNPAAPFQPVKGAIERTLTEFVRFSEDLGAVLVTVHPGSVHSERLVPRATQDAVSTLRQMVKASRGRLSIDVENQTRSRSKYHYPLGSTLESLQTILAEVEGSRFTLDTGHAHASGQDPLAIAEAVGSRLAEVHLSDNSGAGDEHLIPGKGTAPLEALLGRVAQTDALICLELDPYRYTKEQVLAAVNETGARLGTTPGACPRPARTAAAPRRGLRRRS
jgi:sugar phosphate isomerase/epimerase